MGFLIPKVCQILNSFTETFHFIKDKRLEFVKKQSLIYLVIYYLPLYWKAIVKIMIILIDLLLLTNIYSI